LKAIQRFLNRQWIFIPVIAAPVLHALVLEAMVGLDWPAPGFRPWLAAGLAILLGMALTSMMVERLNRHALKHLNRLARTIRLNTINRRFHAAVSVEEQAPTVVLADEINRLRQILVDDINRLQQQVEQLNALHAQTEAALQHEVTAHKSAQQKLQSLARELDNRNRQLQLSLQQSQQADKAKAEFLANMSHEIRTPLNAVLGVASLLERSPLNDRQRQQVGMIFESGKALLNSLSDIMDYVRIEAGEIALDEFPYNLDELLRTIVNRHREEALARGLQYRYSYNPGLPRLFLGDGARVQQLLNNLLDNAIKFTHEGSVEVRVSGVALQDRRYLIGIEVEDTGIGIAEDMRDRLFQVFSQGDTSSTRAYGGSGLGLAIASRLVKLMNGALTLRSEPGRGSLFRVELPMELYRDVAAVVVAE